MSSCVTGFSLSMLRDWSYIGVNFLLEFKVMFPLFMVPGINWFLWVQSSALQILADSQLGWYPSCLRLNISSLGYISLLSPKAALEAHSTHVCLILGSCVLGYLSDYPGQSPSDDLIFKRFDLIQWFSESWEQQSTVFTVLLKLRKWKSVSHGQQEWVLLGVSLLPAK